MQRAIPPALFAIGLLFLVPVWAQDDALPDAAEPALPTPAELEAAGAVIGRIIIDRQNVFDLSNPEENNALYRLANRWHIMTRSAVIEQQLQFRAGDLYTTRLIDESERLLRANRYLYDARITPVRYENGVVDLRVRTRDLWTLNPGGSVSRSGGENRSRLQVSEQNFLGLGVRLRVGYVDNVDRSSTSYEYFDNNLGRSWTSALAEFRDSSDGGTTRLRLIRPFYAMDARWSAGASWFDDEREVRYYELGNEVAGYRAETKTHSAFRGWSSGLVDGWAKRLTAGLVYDQRRFSDMRDDELPSLVPASRKLVYPYVSVDILEDRFQTASNRDQIERTEDFYLGSRMGASLGWADEQFGSDRNALLVGLSASKGFGSMENKSLFVSAAATVRIEDGRARNRRIDASARYYNQISGKRLFFVTFHGIWGKDLDLDSLVQIGGDSGLRGYPLRYQTGESSALLTLEQRYFTDWYPFRLFRIGGALFADLGRVWGNHPAGGQPVGWLKDVGVGLRLAPTRSSGRDMIHIDIAFPLDGDPTIDSVQFLVESRRSF